MKNKDKIPELLSLREVSDLLKVHPNTLRLWDKKGIFKTMRFGSGRDRRCKKEDVQRFIEHYDKEN